jgi:hypothetical protein
VREDPARLAPVDVHAPSGRRGCEACGRPLGPRQRPGARFHGGACRAAGTRARRRAALAKRVIAAESARDEAVAALARMDGELSALRALVEALA